MGTDVIDAVAFDSECLTEFYCIDCLNKVQLNVTEGKNPLHIDFV